MSDGDTPVVSMTEYTGVLRRWSRTVVVATVIGAALGTILVSFQPPEFVSSAVIQVNPLDREEETPGDVRRRISPETEAAVAASQRVAERALALRDAADRLGVDDLATAEVTDLAATIEPDPSEARAAIDRVVVEVRDESQIVEVTATATRADDARLLAQSTALAYLEFRLATAEAEREQSRQRLSDREDELVDELTARSASQRSATDPGYEDIAGRQELTAIGSTYGYLAALAADPGVVLTDASSPGAAEGLPLYAGPVIGGLLGLIVAVTAAFLLDRTDDRLRSGRAELAALGVPLLGTAPARTGAGRLGGSRLFATDSSAGDAYRRLQSTVAFNLEAGDRSVVAVAGVTGAAPSTSVAANLAATAARAGSRTLLVDADLRNAQLASHLGMAPERGLSDVVLAGAALPPVITESDVANLHVLGAGTLRDHPAEVVRSQAFARLLAAVGADFDLVVVEVPPVLAAADAVDVARLCDGSILVVDGASETRQAIADSVAQLRGVGAEVVGVVVADQVVVTR